MAYFLPNIFFLGKPPFVVNYFRNIRHFESGAAHGDTEPRLPLTVKVNISMAPES